MKLLPPENDNYAATVVAIKDIVPLEGCDNVVGTPIFGFQAIVSKDTKIGDLGVVFPAETQLSEQYASENNLFRHQEFNKDESAKGYLEDNRRVKAMKFRGHRSDCLFMPLTSFQYVDGLNIDDLRPGDTFDRLGDYEICQKYVVRRNRRERQLEKNKEKFVRIDKKFLPEHYDSDHYYKNSDVIPPSRTIYVTQKLHGTSIRIGNTVVARKLGLRDRLAQAIGVKPLKTEYDYVFGSRRSIKDVNNPYQNHFYSADIWTEYGKQLDGMLPQGFVAYGELIGYTPEGSPIQRNYTYGVPERTADLYIYRIAHITPDGSGVFDLSWEQVVEFCRDRGLKTVPELWRGQHKDFVVEEFMDKRFRDEGYINAVPLDKESPVDEGVCIRVDGIAPYILKAKGPEFYAHETKMLYEEALDIEAEEN